MENDLVSHVLQLESRLFGVTCLDLRRLAFQIAEANGVDHSFNKEAQMSGKDWLERFRRRPRHSQLAARKPEATSLTRAQAFNKPHGLYRGSSNFSNKQLNRTALTR